VSVYLDVNVLVPLFVVDPLGARAEKAVSDLRDIAVVSDFSAAEFSAVIARRVRTRDLRPKEARMAFSNFDVWCMRHTQFFQMERTDLLGAMSMIRRLDLSLRTPDAVHLAIVQRLGCKLLTFDRTMAAAARAIGVELV
jgi:predicted nucleic acid-binding protein